MGGKGVYWRAVGSDEMGWDSGMVRGWVGWRVEGGGERMGLLWVG